jgi:hypothetical protein
LTKDGRIIAIPKTYFTRTSRTYQEQELFKAISIADTLSAQKIRLKSVLCAGGRSGKWSQGASDRAARACVAFDMSSAAPASAHYSDSYGRDVHRCYGRQFLLQKPAIPNLPNGEQFVL